MLSDALRGLPTTNDPSLLVGFETSDDAAVYRIAPDQVVISTADFITPPVDEPWWFGQIAAANSFSDVYAMGGRPVMALSLVMFPEKKLDIGILREILRGGFEKAVEAGAAMAGGHTVDDLEPKYGLAVTGLAHPDEILKNCCPMPGDALVLTKPVGSGVIFNARRSGKLSFIDIEPMLKIVASLNAPALKAARGFTVHACTDITGFGLAGHVYEMSIPSKTRIELKYTSIPFYPDALPMYKKGETTMNNKPNMALLGDNIEHKAALSFEEKELLFDPQTSGGLLLSVPWAESEGLVTTLRAAGVAHASVIGTVHASTEPRVVIV